MIKECTRYCRCPEKDPVFIHVALESPKYNHLESIFKIQHLFLKLNPWFIKGTVSMMFGFRPFTRGDAEWQPGVLPVFLGLGRLKPCGLDSQEHWGSNPQTQSIGCDFLSQYSISQPGFRKREHTTGKQTILWWLRWYKFLDKKKFTF